MIVTMDRVQKEKEGSWHKTSLKGAVYFEKYMYNCIFTECLGCCRLNQAGGLK